MIELRIGERKLFGDGFEGFLEEIEGRESDDGEVDGVDDLGVGAVGPVEPVEGELEKTGVEGEEEPGIPKESDGCKSGSREGCKASRGKLRGDECGDGEGTGDQEEEAEGRGEEVVVFLEAEPGFSADDQGDDGEGDEVGEPASADGAEDGKDPHACG